MNIVEDGVKKWINFLSEEIGWVDLKQIELFWARSSDDLPSFSFVTIF
jgi:hypothetical protein